MQNGPSRTAFVTDMHRTAHVTLDHTPHILAGTFVCRFVGYVDDAELGLGAIRTSLAVPYVVPLLTQ